MRHQPPPMEWDPHAWAERLHQASLCLRRWQEMADSICGPGRLLPTIPVACQEAEIWRRRALEHVATLNQLAEVAPDPEKARHLLAGFWPALERRCSRW